MSLRPTYIDLKSTVQGASRTDYPTPGDLASPRAGDVPPALSPLDAFALQSRLLAKQLEEGQANGKRISRLLPLTIAKELAKPRPGYARSASGSSAGTNESVSATKEEETMDHSLPLGASYFRPRSIHPFILSTNASTRLSTIPPREKHQVSGRNFHVNGVSSQDYFGVPRPPSPGNLGASADNYILSAPYPTSSRASLELVEPMHHLNTALATDLTFPLNHATLALPRSPAIPRSPLSGSSIRSFLGDSGDETDASSIGGLSDLKFSGMPSAGFVLKPSQSPLSPFFQQHGRSASINSELSIGGTKLSKPAWNFSRPLSRVSQPSMDARPSFESSKSPSPDPSIDTSDKRASSSVASQHNTVVSQDWVEMTGESAHSPISEGDDELFVPHDLHHKPAPSYIYSKFSLPRGRMVQRESFLTPSSTVDQFEWEQTVADGNVIPSTPPLQRLPTSAPPTPPSTREKPSRPQTSDGLPQKLPCPLGQSHTVSPKAPRTSHRPSSSTNSANTITRMSDRTYRSRSTRMTPQQHLERGIEAHEKGGRDAESTYHLRLAAKAGLPTAMLLYALACRHGWGVRPNQAEAVLWLKKAVDSSSIEVADAEYADHLEQPSDILERKTRKAQFALTIYELGMSYMNGWGTQQDKALALRCFEVAGNWGDADALAEAGFCYAKGLGCKKDLKKAANLYRRAEAKGFSMAGNSWIYKEKYQDDATDSGRGRSSMDKAEKKPRDKSRTRTIFGRKKIDVT